MVLTPTEMPPSSSRFFPAGAQLITYRYERGTLQAECTFLVTVQEAQRKLLLYIFV